MNVVLMDPLPSMVVNPKRTRAAQANPPVRATYGTIQHHRATLFRTTNTTPIAKRGAALPRCEESYLKESLADMGQKAFKIFIISHRPWPRSTQGVSRGRFFVLAFTCTHRIQFAEGSAGRRGLDYCSVVL